MKPESYRVATASSELLAPAHCLQLLADGNTEKGDALKTARIAGILAAKRTDELIPLCHPRLFTAPMSILNCLSTVWLFVQPLKRLGRQV